MSEKTTKLQGNVTIIKSRDHVQSKQAKDNKTSVGVRYPKIPFQRFIDLYYNSFVVSGLTDKISTAINSGFVTSDKNLKDVLSKIDFDFLNRNKVLTGNAFFEVIEDWKWMVTDLVPILSNTVHIMESGDGYVQQVGTEKVYFNKFTPLADRPTATEVWKTSGAWDKELKDKIGVWCGYNPNINQIYHFKNTSLDTKYYGASYYEAVVEQLVLVSQIDQYYTRAFDNGMIKTKLLYPLAEKKWLSVDDKKALTEFIKAKMKGIDKAFSLAVVDVEMGQMNLEHDIDANAFIEYRKELLKSVAIALNVPYDLLVSENSNRASSQVSKELFNDITIYPMQMQNIEDLKVLFAEWYQLDDFEYEWIDTNDEKEQMEVLTWYKKAWVMTANEVRKKLKLDPIEWGDELIVDTAQNQRDQLQDFLKTDATGFYKELTKIEHDILKDL